MFIDEAQSIAKDNMDLADRLSWHFSCWGNVEPDTKTQSNGFNPSAAVTVNIAQGDVEDMLMIPKIIFPKFTHLNLGLPSGLSCTLISENRTDSWNDINMIKNLRNNKQNFKVTQKIKISKSPSQLLFVSQVKDRFSGKRGNRLLLELLQIAEAEEVLDSGDGMPKSLFHKEMDTLLKFSLNRNMRQKTCAQFNLLQSLKSELNTQKYMNYISIADMAIKDTPSYDNNQRAKAIRLYKKKKGSRKICNTIKYSERQALAHKRKRVSGRFLGGNGVIEKIEVPVTSNL